MVQKDYILRMIEQMAAIVAQLRRQIMKGDTTVSRRKPGRWQMQLGSIFRSPGFSTLNPSSPSCHRVAVRIR